MKKSLLSILITTTNLVVLTLPSLAQDCPPIPTETRKVTVKTSDATLIEEPKIDGQKSTFIYIENNDKLTVVKEEAVKNNENCFYEVIPEQFKLRKEFRSDKLKENQATEDNKKRNFWIAGSNLSEFPFDLKEASSQLNSSNSSSQKTQTKNEAFEKPSMNQTATKEFSIPLWLTLTLAGITTVSSLGTLFFSSLVFLSQKKKISAITDDIQEIKKNIQHIPNNILPKILLNNDNQLDSYYKRTKAKFKLVLDQIQDLKKLNLSALSVTKSSLTLTPVSDNFAIVTTNNNLDDSNTILSSQNHEAMLIVNQRLDEIITNFNLHNKAYFNDPQFQPLNPSKVSSQGYLEEDGSRMIQLEILNDITQAIFLKFLLDKDNWLIPNLASPHIGNILKILEEYPEIFSIASGTNKLTLTKPAKLKTTEKGLWEIAEIGEFET